MAQDLNHFAPHAFQLPQLIVNTLRIMKRIFFVLILFISVNQVYTQAWEKASRIISGTAFTAREAEIDDANNVYITADFTGDIINTSPAIISKGNNDIVIAKYDSALNQTWIKQIGGTGRDWYPYLSIDNHNNLYVAGAFQGTVFFTDNDSLVSTGSWDIFLAKYTTDGNFVWSKTVATGSSIQIPYDIGVDVNNDIVITGFYRTSIEFENDTFQTSMANFYNFISKYDSTGNHLWAKNIEGNNQQSRINTLSIFDDGYYFAGQFYDSIKFDNSGFDEGSNGEIFLYKTDFDGNEMWARHSTSAGSGLNNTVGIITQDEYGGIYLSGKVEGTGFTADSTATKKSNQVLEPKGEDIYILKYNKNGTLQWARQYGGDGNERGTGIDARNNILYLSGYFNDTIIWENDTIRTQNQTVFLGTFDYDGNPLTATSLANNADASNGTIGEEVILDNTNKAYLFGNYSSTDFIIGDSNYVANGSSDLFIGRYTPPYSIAYTTTENTKCYADSSGKLIITPYFGVPPYTYTWTPGTPNFNDSVAFDLSAGTYGVLVRDAIGNEATEYHIITQPMKISLATDSIINATCYQYNDAAIYITPTGGTVNHQSDYTFNWTGGGGLNISDEDQTGLAANQYYVHVSDLNNCSVTDTFTITEPGQIIFTGSYSIGTTTKGGSDGQIKAYVNGGTPAYTYNWAGPNAPFPDTDTLSGLQGGNYVLQLTDVNGCSADTTIAVSDAGLILISVKNTTPVTCKNDSNGTVQLTVSNASNNLNFYVKDLGHTTLAMSTDSTFHNLAGGTYWAITEEIDSLQRTDSVQFTIKEAADSLSIALDATQPLCYGDITGVINASVSGGKATYNYQWNYQSATTEDIFNLPSDTNYYVLTVSDQYGCSTKDSTQILSPAQLQSTIYLADSNLCYGNNNAALTVVVSGGVRSYNYLWNDPGSQTDSSATNLTQGDYTVLISDANGCSISDSTTITDPQPLSIISVDTSSMTCYGDNNGYIDITVAGGTKPYTYNWVDLPGNNTNRADGLLGQSYTVVISDYYNCGEINKTYHLAAPSEAIQIALYPGTLNGVDCFGYENGSFAVESTGGWVGHLISIDGINFQSKATYSGLAGGTYHVEVKDTKGCNNITEITVSEPDSLELTPAIVSDVTCNGLSNGTIQLHASGGTKPYTFIRTGSTSTTDSIFNNLSAREHTFTISDANNCTDNTTATISEPGMLLLSEILSAHKNLSCYGTNNGSFTITKSGGNTNFEYSTDSTKWYTDSIFNNLQGDSTYTAWVRDEKLCSDKISVTITQPEKISLEEVPGSHNNVLCYGQQTGTIELSSTGGSGIIQYSNDKTNWSELSEFTGLSAAIYTLYARDEQLCTDSVQVNIQEPDSLYVFEYTNLRTEVLCHNIANGSITIGSLGGSGTPQYSINTESYTSDSIFNTLNAGDYQFVVIDTNQCTDTLTITLTEPINPVQLSLESKTNISCYNQNNGEINLSAVGGVAPYAYVLNNSPQQNNSQFTNLAGVLYTAVVFDQNQCTDTLDVEIENPAELSYTDTLVDNNISITAMGGTGSHSYVLSTGTTNQTGQFNGLPNGIYTVNIIDQNGCEIQTVPFNIGNVGIFTQQYNISGQIYPNPSTGTFYIELNGIHVNETQLDIYNLQGQKVYSQKYNTLQGILHEQIGLEQLDKGIYLLVLNGIILEHKLLIE